MNISLLTYTQPYDSIISIILLYFLFTLSKFFFINLNKFNLSFFEIFNLTIIFTSCILYILINFQIDYIFLRPYILITVSLLTITFSIKDYKKKIISKISYRNFFILFIFFILALSPPTDADSLDYHIGGPLEIIKNGKLIFREDWFHYYLISYGEMMNLFGLINGSKNFGQLINFIAIVNIFYIFSLIKNKFNSKLDIHLFLFALPLIIWFVTSSKPQLYQSSLILYGFYLVIVGIKNQEIVNNKNIIILSIFYTFCIYSKISFIFSISILNLLLLIYNKKIVIKKYIALIFLIFLILGLPKLGSDYYVYGKFFFPYIEIYLNFANLEIVNFLNTLKNDSATLYNIERKFIIFTPLLLSVPFKISTLSAMLSLNFIFLYLSFFLLVINFTKKKNSNLSFFLFILIFLILLILGLMPNLQPRYMLEVYWLHIITLFIFLKSEKLIKFINRINFLQTCLIIAFSIISIFNLTIGSLSKDQYLKVMRKNAHNFNQAEWILNNIGKDKIILSENLRSYVFLKNFLSREKYFKFYEDNQIKLLENGKYDYISLNYPIKSKEIKNFIKRCTDYKNAKTESFNIETRNFLSPIRKKEQQIILLKKIC